MSNSELKMSLHKIIEKIDNEDVLKALYNLLVDKIPVKDGQLWKHLSDDQKNDLMLAFAESDDPEQLLSNEEVMKEFRIKK
jgi:hypothetical protein